MKESDTKRLVQGALFVAIYCIFFLVSKFSGGFLESVLFFILPLPLAIFSFRYGIKKAFVPFVAIIIVGCLINVMSTIFYVLTANVLGVIYGELIRKNAKETTIILVSAIASMVVNTLTMIIFANLFNYDISLEINQIVTWIFTALKISDNQEFLMMIVKRSIPTFIFFMGLVEGFMVHVCNLYVMRRLKLIDRPMTNFMFIAIPRWLSYVYLPIGIAFAIMQPLYFMDPGIVGIITGIVFNLFWMGAILFFFQGYLTSIIFARRKDKMIPFIFILIGVILLNPIYAIFLFMLIGYGLVISDYYTKILYNK